MGVAMMLSRSLLAVSVGVLLRTVGAQDSTPGGPTHPNIAPNCNAFHTVVDGDGCWSIQQKYGISAEDFLAWNPDVSEDCLTNFWLGNAYCVGVGAAVTTSSTSSVVSTSSGPITQTTAVTTPNATYSTRVPVTEWNITGTTIGTTFPPQKTQAGQHADCIDWHYVGDAHTCAYIVESYGGPELTMSNFLSWNPAIGSDCGGLIWDTWVCVSIKPQTSTFSYNFPTANGSTTPIPEPTDYTPTSLPPVETLIPSPTQPGLSPSCRAFYKAQADDNCQVILGFGVSTEEQFFEWNPALDGNCNGLWLDYFYCIAAYDPLDTDNLPPLATVTSRPSNVAGGTTGLCTVWYQASKVDTCDSIVGPFGRFSLAEFLEWNLGVGSDCSGIQAGWSYCVAIPGTPTDPTSDPDQPSIPTGTPTQTGIATDCSDFWLVSSDDTCASIADHNGITVEQLLTWNPALGTTSCSGLKADVYVCVATGGSSGSATLTAPPITATTSSAPPTTTTEATIQTPSPVQEGMVSGCRRFYFTLDGDGCWAIANAAGIDLNDFYAWNPAVGTDCLNLWRDTWYCIGISGPATTISGGPPVPT
ncbi:carbohydrate-binding module family 50 protein [Colletotrichum asianum]